MRLHEYAGYDATGLAELVSRREVTAVELVRLAREAHHHINPTINAVVEFYEDAESVPCSAAGPFSGVPFLRKDVGPTEAGRLQERGSRLFQGYRPNVESYYIERARAGGLRIVGRTTTTELGVSGLSETVSCGITRNPWNLDRTAGGSSSGSAAAVASGIVPIASCGDGGGSTRIPAAYCGLVGLNPSRGRISGGPDQQDPGYFGNVRNFVLCRTIRDMAATLDVLSGSYPGDPFLIPQPGRPYVEELSRPSSRLRVGVALSSWAEVGLDPEIRNRVAETAKVLEGMGHAVEEIHAPFSASDYRQLIVGQFYLGRVGLDAAASVVGRKVDETTLELLNLKLYEEARDLPLSYAPKLFEYARKIRFDVGTAVQGFDLLLTPTMPCTALPHDAYSTTLENMPADDLLTFDAALCQYLGIFSVTGHPSVSLPLFTSTEGLPIGVQIVGRFGDEATVVRVARDLEEAIPWSTRRPPVFAGITGEQAPLAATRGRG